MHYSQIKHTYKKRPAASDGQQASFLTLYTFRKSKIWLKAISVIIQLSEAWQSLSPDLHL